MTQVVEGDFSDDSIDDFQLITRKDLPIHPDSPDLRSDTAISTSSPIGEHSTVDQADHSTAADLSSRSSTPSPSTSHLASPATPHAYLTSVGFQPRTSKSHSLLSRLKNFSRISLDHFPQRSVPLSTKVPQPSQLNREVEITNLVLEFPQPPSRIPTPIASAYSTGAPAPFSETVPVDDTPSVFFHPEEPIIRETPLETTSEAAGEHSLFLSPHPSTISLHAPSDSATVKRSSIFPVSIKNFKSFTKTAFRTSFLTAPIVSSTYTAKARRNRRKKLEFVAVSPLNNSPPRITLEPLPELNFENTDFAHFPSSESITASPQSHLLFQSSPVIAETPNLLTESEDQKSPERHTSSQSTSNSTAYQCVDPLELTASPPFLGSDLFGSSARTSFIPPSPSWLSRNVQGLEPYDLRPFFGHPEISPLLDLEIFFPPPSPPPLPIPPRFSVTPPSPKPIPETFPTLPEADTELSVLILESCSNSPASSTSTSCTASLKSRSSPSYLHCQEPATISHRHSVLTDKNISTFKENRPLANPLLGVSIPLSELFLII